MGLSSSNTIASQTNSDWRRIQRTVWQTRCEPYVFGLGCLECDPLEHCEDYAEHHWYLQAFLERKDIVTGNVGQGHGARYLIDSDISESAITRRLLRAALDYAEHEVRESFTWAGKRIYGPHIEIESLWNVSEASH